MAISKVAYLGGYGNETIMGQQLFFVELVDYHSDSKGLQPSGNQDPEVPPIDTGDDKRTI